MSKKLAYLTKVSLKKKIGTKWFLIANLVMLIAIVSLANVDSIIKAFGGNFSTPKEIMVIDNADVFDSFNLYYNETNKYLDDISSSTLELYTDSIESGKEIVEKEGRVLIVIDENDTNFLSLQIFSKSGMDVVTSQIITASITSVKQNMALEHYNISGDVMASISSPVNIVHTNLDDDKVVDNMMEIIMSTVFPILILPFFMLTIFLVQMIGAEVNEEKTTKSMEIIISNVSPRTHFISKILAGNLFVILQGILLITMAGVGVLSRIFISGSLFSGGSDVSNFVSDTVNSLTEMGIMDKLAYTAPFMLLLMVITFVAYSLLAGILASMTTNIEDYQQVQAPIIVLSLIGYYLSIMSAVFEGSTFIRIVSYIPFISASLSPALLIVGQIGIVDMLISLGLMVVTVFILFKYGLKIYKVGILNYSSSGLWKKMFKAAKA